MLGRLGLAGRIIAILLLSLLVLLALGAGVGYVARKQETAGDPLTLLPERAAAIVGLMEKETAGADGLLLKAVTSEELSVRRLEVRPGVDEEHGRLPGVEWVVGQHFPEGDTREVIAYMEPEKGPRWSQLRLGRMWLTSRETLHIAIGLKNGGYALFETRGDVAPRLFGFPPGFVIGALGAVVGIAALLAIWREARPLRELADAVSHFSGERPPHLVAENGAPEIRGLIVAVNDMQSRIAALVKGRTMLLGAVSHDLRTYLTRLRLRIEAIEDGEQREKSVRDLEDMGRLVDDALAVARGSALSDLREPVDIPELIGKEVAEEAAGRASCETHGAISELVVVGDGVALRRLFSNLLSNALRYGSQCRISVSREKARVIVTVDDDGPGIPEEERENVFEPFYRLESSRNRDTGGSGLGLAIARQIAVGHGGSIHIEASPMGGTRFAVSLPA